MDRVGNDGDDEHMSISPTKERTMSTMTDADFAALAAAERARGLANAPRVTSKWCECCTAESSDEEHNRVSNESSYFARENFSHGWFHDPALGGCGGITQTG